MNSRKGVSRIYTGEVDGLCDWSAAFRPLHHTHISQASNIKEWLTVKRPQGRAPLRQPLRSDPAAGLLLHEFGYDSRASGYHSKLSAASSRRSPARSHRCSQPSLHSATSQRPSGLSEIA